MQNSARHRVPAIGCSLLRTCVRAYEFLPNELLAAKALLLRSTLPQKLVRVERVLDPYDYLLLG